MSLVHSESPRYYAYLLRVWETRSLPPDQPSTWRFSLEDSETGQKGTFPDLDALVAFLQALLKDDLEEP